VPAEVVVGAAWTPLFGAAVGAPAAAPEMAPWVAAVAAAAAPAVAAGVALVGLAWAAAAVVGPACEAVPELVLEEGPQALTSTATRMAAAGRRDQNVDRRVDIVRALQLREDLLLEIH
jgi:hypothetical protein